jgi:hypothetical protein
MSFGGWYVGLSDAACLRGTRKLEVDPPCLARFDPREITAVWFALPDLQVTPQCFAGW